MSDSNCHNDWFCNDYNQCTEDTCDENGQCHYDPVDCDDGNPCTDDSCSSAVGCQYADNANPCEDGNLCTEPDICAGGACVPGSQVDCDNNDVCDGDETCDPATGSCLDGTPLDCIDDNPCTDDYCDPQGGCQNPNKPDGAPCTDNDACTEYDRCEDGTCVADPVGCDDGDVCTDDDCNPAIGCEYDYNTASCDDEDPCTIQDACGVCQGGENQGKPCVGEPDCPDGACAPGGVCQGMPKPCDDGLDCTEDSCDAATGVCEWTPLDSRCNDNVACTTDTCDPTSGDPTTGCVNQPNDELCNDNVECTVDVCDPEQGCLNTPEDEACDDDDECTLDHCEPASPDADPVTGCWYEDRVCPSDDDDCTEDYCDPEEPDGCVYEDECLIHERDNVPSPPEATDRLFVDRLSGASGTTAPESLHASIPVTRYAGETRGGDPDDPDTGTLVYAADHVASGFMKKRAKLRIASHGVGNDENVVKFNGTPMDELGRGFNQSARLRGALCGWWVKTYDIPIWKVKFPSAPGSGGAGPLAADNTLDIEFNDPVPDNCRRFAYVTLEIGVMSPIVLLHGNGSDGGFWDRQRFTNELQSRHLVYDNSISLPNGGTNRVAQDSTDFADLLPKIAGNFGVDSVHLVAHSKGGLVSRKYLASNDYRARKCRGGGNNGQVCQSDTDCPNGTCRKPFDVVSLTTLATPHDGSVLADLVELKRNRDELIGVTFRDFPLFQAVLASWAAREDSPAHQDLTTSAAAVFNGQNVPILPPTIAYNRVAGDADLNGSGTIDTFDELGQWVEGDLEIIWLTGLPLEDEGLRKAPGPGGDVVDEMYQILGSYGSLRLARHGDSPVVTYRVVDVLPPSTFEPNDTLVTVMSATGSIGGYGDFAKNQTGGAKGLFMGYQGRNHATVANEGVAQVVVGWVKGREASHGDLH